MPPIPTYKNAPIKADGVTPQTADDSNPAPTPTSRYVPATTTVDSSSPPAPQPGARPTPTASASSHHDGPPPPQPGFTPQSGYTATHITTETRTNAPPPQITQPPPSDSQLAGRSTVTSTTASKPGPTTLNFGPAASPFQSADVGGAAPSATADGGRRSLEHPPGYQQAPDNAPYTQGGGIGGGDGGGEGIGAQAWGMLSRAGEALKGAEEAAWKAVNGKK